MKRTFLVVALVLGAVTFAAADLSMPTVTAVFFQKGGRPYERPVDFTVKCYGYSWAPGRRPEQKIPGTYTPENVFSFSARCPRYGCEIHEPFYMNYRHVDYCDMEGTAGGQPFQIAGYGTDPVDFDKCTPAAGRFGRRCALTIALPE
jgi:hypothetical protein